jgi:hypothetical protein
VVAHRRRRREHVLAVVRLQCINSRLAGCINDYFGFSKKTNGAQDCKCIMMEKIALAS